MVRGCGLSTHLQYVSEICEYMHKNVYSRVRLQSGLKMSFDLERASRMLTTPARRKMITFPTYMLLTTRLDTAQNIFRPRKFQIGITEF